MFCERSDWILDALHALLLNSAFGEYLLEMLELSGVLSWLDISLMKFQFSANRANIALLA